MSVRFRRTLKLFPGFRLNFTRRGISGSVGGKGFSHTVGTRGQRTTVGIPGSGLSYSTHHGRGRRSQVESMPVNQADINRRFARFLVIVAVFLGCIWLAVNYLPG
jgi:hypothetical protein